MKTSKYQGMSGNSIGMSYNGENYQGEEGIYMIFTSHGKWKKETFNERYLDAYKSISSYRACQGKYHYWSDIGNVLNNIWRKN